MAAGETSLEILIEDITVDEPTGEEESPTPAEDADDPTEPTPDPSALDEGTEETEPTPTEPSEAEPTPAEPPPTEPAPAEPAPVEESDETTAEVAPEPPPVEERAVFGDGELPAQTAEGSYLLQLAAYPTRDEADTLVAELRSSGVEAHVQEAAVQGSTWYRVRIGRFGSRRDVQVWIDALAPLTPFEPMVVAE